VFRNLNCERMQVDECWSFVFAKDKNLTEEIAANNPGCGDASLWAAIDAETKLVPCWLIGKHDPNSARDFVADLASRLANRIQPTSDGLKMDIKAVDKAFADDIDYAQLVKVYGSDPEGEKRHSPAVCLTCKKNTITSQPGPTHINTSYIERHNLSVRMTVRRFTRLTNAFSKKIEKHIASVALGYFAYNFITIHRTLPTSPAVTAGVGTRLWDVSDLVAESKAWERSEMAAQLRHFFWCA
jgi:hypothetical protein